MRGSITIAVASFGAERLRDGAQHVFGALLDVRVERQLDALARHFGVGFGDRDGLSDRVADDAPFAGVAVQRRFVAELDAGQPLAFGADLAEHLGGQRRRAGRHASSPGVPVTPGIFSASAASAWRAGTARSR